MPTKKKAAKKKAAKKAKAKKKPKPAVKAVQVFVNGTEAPI